MAKVKMTEYVRIPGVYEPIENIYEYTYCDKCGSFKLGYPPSDPLGIILTSSALLLFVAAIGVLIFSSNLAVSWVISLLCFSLCLVFGLLGFSLSGRLRCENCGNEKFASNNVLNYSQEDRSVIDTPIENVKKKHLRSIMS